MVLGPYLSSRGVGTEEVIWFLPSGGGTVESWAGGDSWSLGNLQLLLAYSLRSAQNKRNEGHTVTQCK